MASGFGTSRFRSLTPQEYVERFRGYTRSILHTVGEFVTHYLSLWQMADTVVTDYEAARRLLRQMPHDWIDWVQKLVEEMTTEDPVTFARLIDFPRLVVIIVAQWATIHSPPIALPSEPGAQWSPVSLRQGMSTEPYPPVHSLGIGTSYLTPLRRDRNDFEASTSYIPEISPLQTAITSETVIIPRSPLSPDSPTRPWRNTVRMRVGAINTFTLPLVGSESDEHLSYREQWRRLFDLSEDSEEDSEEDPEEDPDHDQRVPSWGQSNRDGDE